MAYLLDANVFIQAKNLHYGLDFCPAFWKWLTEKNASEKVFSIEKAATNWKQAETNSPFGQHNAVPASLKNRMPRSFLFSVKSVRGRWSSNMNPLP
jgi:hypothetical protein